MQKNITHCFCSPKLLKHIQSKDIKYSKAKENHFLATNGNNRNSSQSRQALSRFWKKKYLWVGEASKANLQKSWPLAIILLLFKKIKKQSNRDLSQVECLACYKNSHYISKCLDKKPKNQWWSWQFIYFKLRLLKRQSPKFKKSLSFNKSRISIPLFFLVSFLLRSL